MNRVLGMRWLPWALAVAALGATVAAAALFLVARQFYQQRSELRLEPVHDGRYSDENARLPVREGERVVFFGDSRIAGWSPRPVLTGAELVWRGIDGETTGQMAHRFDSDVLGLSPSAVVIQAGINDLVAGAAVGDLPRAERLVLANLRTMVDRASAAGVRVLLLTVVPPAEPPLWRRPVWSDAIRESVARVNQAVLGWRGGSLHVIDTAQALGSEGGTLPADLAVDTLHFNESAYGLLNRDLEALWPHAVQ